MKTLGEKIVVVGVSASGKTTFSRKLASKTNLPVFFVDSIMWRPGWNHIGDEEMVKKLNEIGAGDRWIIEGYISKGARTFIFERADTIIYLDYSPWVNTFRCIKRWWKHRKDPRPELEGSPERLNFKKLKLVWTKGEAISLNRFLNEVQDKSKIVKLKSPKEARVLLREVN